MAYSIVDTDQTWCFSDAEAIQCGDDFVGQDAQYEGLQPAYQDNGDGTVTDLNTGLMWIQDAGDKKFHADAIDELETYTYAGFDDWRLPSIKELYSLALFSGVDASRAESSDVDGLWPLMDDDYFVVLYGDETGSERVIDAQWLTSSVYGSTVMGGQSCFFGFNFVDGRIKCYPLEGVGNGYFAQYVRGSEYGVNDYVENGDDTITDDATGLTWTQNDSGEALAWEPALDYCEALTLGGSDDWRLPNIKELHSVVDYERSPDVTDSPAIDPLFNLTPITNEAGESDYGSHWSSTTLIAYPSVVEAATYVSFGRSLGYMEELGGWIDVHGAGAQRSDPKVPSDETFETGAGPQGDAVRMYNYVLCVNGGVAEASSGDDPSTLSLSDEEFTAGAASDDGITDTGETGSEEPDLAAAAVMLGITEQELMGALGAPPPDLEAAADTLGITVEELRNALGL
ncbi:MAG: DUF1566 domain-containing protein [Actinomycetia bacterium]|nr:DUF1566 domain-containing protein [Actinomycetes bacterium]